jgi:hypothetical protein
MDSNCTKNCQMLSYSAPLLRSALDLFKRAFFETVFSTFMKGCPYQITSLTSCTLSSVISRNEHVDSVEGILLPSVLRAYCDSNDDGFRAPLYSLKVSLSLIIRLLMSLVVLHTAPWRSNIMDSGGGKLNRIAMVVDYFSNNLKTRFSI